MLLLITDRHAQSCDVDSPCLGADQKARGLWERD